MSGSLIIVVESSELSSAHGAKQQHLHFVIPGDPALTTGCVKGAKPSRSAVEDDLYSADREVRHPSCSGSEFIQW
jgi:hypothetical protein